MTKIPDRMELERWLRAGETNAEVIARYREQGIDITSAGIAMFRRRHGLEMMRDVRTLIAWPVAKQHRALYPARMLRFEQRRRGGRPLDARQEGYLDAWIEKLTTDDLVVHYEAETDIGWHYVPRRPGIDTDLIRDPNYADDGSLIEG